jgi:hypothetical protein
MIDQRAVAQSHALFQHTRRGAFGEAASQFATSFMAAREDITL